QSRRVFRFAAVNFSLEQIFTVARGPARFRTFILIVRAQRTDSTFLLLPITRTRCDFARKQLIIEHYHDKETVL
ncbi:MAG: hypothetical protein DMF70_09480, partial [Acidobacteria bacterium]